MQICFINWMSFGDIYLPYGQHKQFWMLDHFSDISPFVQNEMVFFFDQCNKLLPLFTVFQWIYNEGQNNITEGMAHLFSKYEGKEQQKIVSDIHCNSNHVRNERVYNINLSLCFPFLNFLKIFFYLNVSTQFFRHDLGWSL